MTTLSAGQWVGRFVLAAAGALILGAAWPAVAQTRAPGDRETWSNESQKPASPPPAAEERSGTSRQPATQPPSRRDDESDQAPAGCQYRGNKLDLLV